MGVSIMRLFAVLLIHPRKGIDRILDARPSFLKIAAFLLLISAARGVVECVWVLLRSGQLGYVFSHPESLWGGYGALALPFLASSITCGFVRWVGFALAACLLARFLGGQGRFSDCLRVCGVALGIYFVTIVPNFAYLLVELPSIQFDVSPYYKPTIGVGQLLTSVWLVFVLATCARRVFGVSRFSSALIGMAIMLSNIGVLVLACQVFFNLSPFTLLSFRDALNVGTIIFVAATILCTGACVAIGIRQDAHTCQAVTPLTTLASDRRMANLH